MAKKLDLPKTIHSVATLFQDFDGLLMGFNEFLPPDLKIQISGGSSMVGSGAQRSNVTVRLAVVSHMCCTLSPVLHVVCHLDGPSDGDNALLERVPTLSACARCSMLARGADCDSRSLRRWLTLA
jgi:hypothetical protein